MNEQGLSRRIPNEVKREVRRRYGFGCVVCGKAIIEYDHFDVEFSEASLHDPDQIIILCSEHHAKKTRGMLSSETIEKHRNAPAALRAGFSHDVFDVGGDNFEIVVGTSIFIHTRVLIRLSGEDIISLLPPEEPGGPMRINAAIRDSAGNFILEIKDNEWRPTQSNWDVVQEAGRITFRSANRQLDLVLASDPPRRLTVERMHMLHQGWSVEIENNVSTFTKSTGKKYVINGMRTRYVDVAIDLW